MLNKFTRGDKNLLRLVQDILAKDETIVVFGRAGTGRITLLAELANHSVQKEVLCTLVDYEPIRERMTKHFVRTEFTHVDDDTIVPSNTILISTPQCPIVPKANETEGVLTLLNCQASAEESRPVPSASMLYNGFDGYVIKTEHGKNGSPMIQFVSKVSCVNWNINIRVLFQAPCDWYDYGDGVTITVES